jgi:hypothetical protein
MKAQNPLTFAAGFVTASLISVVIFTQRPAISTVIRGVTPVLEQWSTFYNPIVKAGVQFPDVVMSQFILETGYGESEVFKTNGNGFGMKHNKRGFSKGSKLGHADYGGDFTKSLADYIAWQKKYLAIYENKRGVKIKTDEQYIDFLKNYGYAEDPPYALKLANILEYVKKVRELKEAQS